MKDPKGIAAVQVAGMEMDQIAEEARVDPVPAEDQEGTMRVQTTEEGVKMVHQVAEIVAILQDVQVIGHLHQVRPVVVTVEAGVSVHLQEAAQVLPEMEGEQAKRKVALLQVAGEILVDPAKK